MQTYRLLPRTVAPRACKSACSPPRNIFTSSPFLPIQGQQHYNSPSPFASDLAPLFRILDSTLDNLIPAHSAERASRRLASASSFTPRFDVRELPSGYELQGEVPGVEQADLEIEFVDERVLVIRGRGQSHSGAGPAAVEDAKDSSNAVKGKENEDAAGDKSAAAYQKASVEEENEDGFVDAGAGAPETEKKASSAEVAKGKEPEAVEAADPATSVPEPDTKYWVTERSSIGAFERRFAFPGRVDQEAVKASLRNGILSVVVPKIVGGEARKVVIH